MKVVHLVTLSLLLLMTNPPPALNVLELDLAADKGKSGSADVSGNALLVGGQLSTAAEDDPEPAPASAEAAEVAGAWIQQDVCESVNAGGCVETYRCPDGTAATIWWLISSEGVPLERYTQCPGDPAPSSGSAPLTVTADQVLERFRQIPLPASTITIQPPGGKTLVNLETVYSTTAAPFTRTVTFFNGQIVVDLAIAPTRFTWHHGDGTTQTTTTPGRPWTPTTDPTDLILHTYTTTATDLPARVDTTWSATWTMNGQPQGPVNGTVTRPGTPTPLDVLQAKPKLVR